MAVLDASDIPGRNCFGVIPPFADQPVFAEETACIAVMPSRLSLEKPIYNRFDEADFPITWDPHDTMLTPEAAMAVNAPNLHESRDGNILVRGYVECGDADSALAAAKHKVEIRTKTPLLNMPILSLKLGTLCARAIKLLFAVVRRQVNGPREPCRDYGC